MIEFCSEYTGVCYFFLYFCVELKCVLIVIKIIINWFWKMDRKSRGVRFRGAGIKLCKYGEDILLVFFSVFVFN